MNVLFACDLHVGSPIEMDRARLMAEGPRPNFILGGDIIDGANCPKDEVKYYRNLLDVLMREHGDNFIPGNHSRIGWKDTTNYVIRRNEKGEGILFAHGDLEANPSKWKEYREKDWGAGFFKRKFVVPFIREAEEIINRKPKEDFLVRAAHAAISNGCTYYVCGHFHVKEIVRVKYMGVTIIICPRGFNELEF